MNCIFVRARGVTAQAPRNVILDPARLDLDVHVHAVSNRVESLIESWYLMITGEPHLCYGGRIRPGECEGPVIGRENGVVMYEYDAVPAGMDVELDGFGATFDRGDKRRNGVFRRRGAKTAMGYGSWQWSTGVHRIAGLSVDFPLLGRVCGLNLNFAAGRPSNISN
jgi:hypothetical protein